MKNYLLFDLDGTLTDSKIGITKCVAYALEYFGIIEKDLDKLEPFIGPPLKESFMNFYGFDEDKANKAVEKYRERYENIGIFENSLYKGIKEMLFKLKKEHMHLAVASSKPEVFVNRILKHFKIDQYFDVVVGSKLSGERVNKDEVIGEALSRMFNGQRVEREKIYMIGDTRFDVCGSKKQGIESVAVLYGFGTLEELKEEKADYIVDSVEELSRFLLRDVREETYKNQQNIKTNTKIWAIAYPIVLFVVVRTISTYILTALCQFIGTHLLCTYTRWMFILDANDNILGFTGNAGAFVTVLTYLAAAFCVLKRAKKSIEWSYELNRLSYIRPKKKSDYVLGIVMLITAVIGFNMLISLLKISELSETYTKVAESQYSAVYLVGILCYGFVTPICEELLFRGWVYNVLSRFLSIKTAIYLSAFLFGIYHLNTVQGLYAFIIGIVIAITYDYFGTFKAPVLAHMIANITAYSMPAELFNDSILLKIIICTATLISFFVCLYILARRKKHMY